MRTNHGAVVAVLLSAAGAGEAWALQASATAAPTPPSDLLAAPALSLGRVADGDRLMQERRYREAAFAYLDAVHADPASVEANFKLANAFAVLGFFDQAILHWTRASERSSDAAVRKSAEENIVKARQRAQEVGGGSPPLQGKAPGAGPIADAARDRARAAYEAGVKQVTARDYAAGVKSLGTAITNEPTLTVAYVARGSALIGLKRPGEALLDYLYAHRLSPATASPLYGMAEAYRALGRIPEARESYQRYLESTAADIRPALQDDARRKLEKL